MNDRNPLLQLIAIAEKNRDLWKEFASQELTSLLTLPAENFAQQFPEQNAAVVYPRKELGGVAGLYSWILQ